MGVDALGSMSKDYQGGYFGVLSSHSRSAVVLNYQALALLIKQLWCVCVCACMQCCLAVSAAAVVGVAVVVNAVAIAGVGELIYQ